MHLHALSPGAIEAVVLYIAQSISARAALAAKERRRVRAIVASTALAALVLGVVPETRPCNCGSRRGQGSHSCRRLRGPQRQIGAVRCTREVMYHARRRLCVLVLHCFGSEYAMV